MRYRVIIGVLGVLLLATCVVEAQEMARPYRVQLRLRAEYDDNIFTRKDPKLESWKFIADPQLTLAYPTDQTFIGGNYRLGYVYYDDRPTDDTDVNHDLDVTLSHAFSPRFSLNFTDIFRIGQEPEVIASGAVVQRNGDFQYNSAALGGTYSIDEMTRLDAGYRYIFLKYDEDEVAANLDYDTHVLNVDLSRVLQPTTTGVLGYRYEALKYDQFSERDQDSHYFILGADKIFSPQFLASLNVGWQHTEYDQSSLSSDDKPYADLSGTWTYSATGRLLVGFRYSQEPTDVGTFVNQERAGIYASLSQDITPVLALYLAASYDDSKMDKSATGEQVKDGNEQLTLFSARLEYKVYEMLALETGYQYSDLSSDFDRGYDRNRFHVGLRAFY
jgi:opacity protein-like surface antigen